MAYLFTREIQTLSHYNSEIHVVNSNIADYCTSAKFEYHALEKRTNKQKTKTEINLNPLRNEWLNAAKGFMYREDGIWFYRRQDLWDKIRSLLSFHSSDLKRHFPPTIFITLRLILEYMSEHMDARYSHLFPSMSTHWFQQWRILKGNRERNQLMTTQMPTKYLNRGRISYLMAYTLSAKKQQCSLISINPHDKWIKG